MINRNIHGLIRHMHKWHCILVPIVPKIALGTLTRREPKHCAYKIQNIVKKSQCPLSPMTRARMVDTRSYRKSNSEFQKIRAGSGSQRISNSVYPNLQRTGFDINNNKKKILQGDKKKLSTLVHFFYSRPNTNKGFMDMECLALLSVIC